MRYFEPIFCLKLQRCLDFFVLGLRFKLKILHFTVASKVENEIGWLASIGQTVPIDSLRDFLILPNKINRRFQTDNPINTVPLLYSSSVKNCEVMDYLFNFLIFND